LIPICDFWDDGDPQRRLVSLIAARFYRNLPFADWARHGWHWRPKQELTHSVIMRMQKESHPVNVVIAGWHIR
jgi:hypothetical protein